MRVNRIIFAGVCALALVVGAVNAGQTSQEKQATSEMTKKVYPLECFLQYTAADLATAAAEGEERAEQNIATRLVKRITESVAPETWSDVGGKATMRYSPRTKELIVTQTGANQDKIIELFALMEKESLEVAVETRFMTMSTAKAELFLKLADFQQQPASNSNTSPTTVAFLKDKQVKGWFELLQGDPACNIMQAPKITMFDGQKVPLTIGDEVGIPRLVSDGQAGDAVVLMEKVFCGIQASFLPIVSADRHFVRLQLGWHATSLEKEPKGQSSLRRVALDSTVVIPANGTAVFCLGNQPVAKRTETSGPPVLSKVPYVNRLFTNEAYRTEEQALFLMVTTRVITNESGNEATKAQTNNAPVYRTSP